MNHPRLLIEEWLPAQALGIECMRERQYMSPFPPNTRLHVWWARRPLVVSRAAVLASLLPADFDRSTFEQLLGFYAPSKHIIATANRLALKQEGAWIKSGHGKRAFANAIRETSVVQANESMQKLWGESVVVIDPMSGGGSIPLESSRMGINTVAVEYNPVACSVLEATLHYPLRYGPRLADVFRAWASEWERRFIGRIARYYNYDGLVPPRDYIFARTVPCPDTGYPTPLVPDWSLLRPKGGRQLVAVPRVVDAAKGKWTVDIAYVGRAAGEVRHAPNPTYKGGHGVSLFSLGVIPGDYIKAMAQQGQMGSVLLAVATNREIK